MFDATEAVNDLIDEINEDYYESCYNAIYEELCERVECGELTIEDAEMINEAAAEKYLYESKYTTAADFKTKLNRLDNQIAKYRNYVAYAKTPEEKEDMKRQLQILNQRYDKTEKAFKNFMIDKELKSNPKAAGVPVGRSGNGSQIKGAGLSKKRYNKK